jgi:hypothetical protein
VILVTAIWSEKDDCDTSGPWIEPIIRKGKRDFGKPARLHCP